MSHTIRHFTDGKPYYCRLCGGGFGEYIACEMPDCELESETEARKRRAKSLKRTKEKVGRK